MLLIRAFHVSTITFAALVGCVQPVADHCGNNDGDKACRERFPDGSAPYCSLCASENHGCKAEPVTDAACVLDVDSNVTTTSTASTSSSTSTSSETSSTTEAPTTSTSEVDASSSTTEPEPDPVCGNEVIEGDENCDGRDLGGFDCERVGLGDGYLACQADCMGFDLGGCDGKPMCGNDLIEGNEQCDNGMFGDAQCSDVDGFIGGQLGCDHCMFDTTNCTPCLVGGVSCNVGAECCSGTCINVLSLIKACTNAN